MAWARYVCVYVWLKFWKDSRNKFCSISQVQFYCTVGLVQRDPTGFDQWAIFQNVKTRRPIITKWCVKQQIPKIWNRKGKRSCHWNYHTVVIYTNVYQWNDSGQRFSAITFLTSNSIPLLQSEIIVQMFQCFVCNLISIFRFGRNCASWKKLRSKHQCEIFQLRKSIFAD